MQKFHVKQLLLASLLSLAIFPATAQKMYRCPSAGGGTTSAIPLRQQRWQGSHRQTRQRRSATETQARHTNPGRDGQAQCRI
jgi:hypothetical protein